MARNANYKNTRKMPAIADKPVHFGIEGVTRKYIEMARTSFDEAKAKFIREVELNPASAIRWASSIMEEQAEFECWLMVEKMIELIGTDIGKERGIECIRTAIAAAVERITDDIMSSIGNGESTSLCSRAQHTAEQVGRKNCLPRIKGLLRCED
jgi:hypothetical protein